MQGNSGKCHFILSTNKSVEMQTGESLIKSTNYKKLFLIKIDFKLTFDKHKKAVCNRASDKFRELARVTTCMTFYEKKKKDFNAVTCRGFIL